MRRWYQRLRAARPDRAPSIDSKRWVFNAVAAACYFALMLGCKSEPVVRPGDTFFSSGDDTVSQLTLRSASQRAQAHRFRAQGPFWYTFETASGAKFERCRATPALEQMRRALQSLRAIGVLSKQELQKLIRTLPKKAWIDLEVRGEDYFWYEAFQLRLTEANAPKGRIYAYNPFDEDEGYVLDAAALRLLRAHCPP